MGFGAIFVSKSGETWFRIHWARFAKQVSTTNPPHFHNCSPFSRPETRLVGALVSPMEEANVKGMYIC